MTSCILMSRSSSVAADTASFRGETKAGMRTGVAGKTGRESASLSTRGMSSEDPGCERERWADITIWPHTPTPPPPFLSHSRHGNGQKHLLGLQGRLGFLFRVSHTVAGCVHNDRVCQAQCHDFRGVEHFILTNYSTKKEFFYIFFFEVLQNVCASCKSKTEERKSKQPWGYFPCFYKTLHARLRRISRRAGR